MPIFRTKNWKVNPKLYASMTVAVSQTHRATEERE